jgi:3-phosphoglycerate kinase
VAKLFIEDLLLRGKRVLMRVDFNVPVKDGRLENDGRVRATLPSIRYALGRGASLVLPSTIDAAALGKMAERGQIERATLDGPLAFDNAISGEAARIKGIASPVAGDPDVLVVPALEAGNMLAKNVRFLARADAAGIVIGARVPIILTSRADNGRTRMAPCAAAGLYARASTARAGR